jgi:hypothetical protein
VRGTQMQIILTYVRYICILTYRSDVR